MSQRWSTPEEMRGLIESLQSDLNGWVSRSLEEIADLRRKFAYKPESITPEMRKLFEEHLERAEQKRRTVAYATANLLRDFKALKADSGEGEPTPAEDPRFASGAVQHTTDLFHEMLKPVKTRAMFAVKAEGRERVEIEDLSRAFRDEILARAAAYAKEGA